MPTRDIEMWSGPVAMAQDEGIVDCGVLCEVMSHIYITTKHDLLMKQFNWHLLGVGSRQPLEVCPPFLWNSEYIANP